MNPIKFKIISKILAHTLFFLLMVYSFFHYDFLGLLPNILWGVAYTANLTKRVLLLRNFMYT
ncbi:hypothetical protein [Rufibacter latericius]|uniref:Uncharacterized protein n=1 Tax=Rufibacter latericius TaxID=2487040 RepID=A0A3M9N3F7_9BACT|nr:hypothetical protein [Rufibacter latericius]RNI31538.1 hypothetical protein EFB08_03190 [Rufibacter latericius]